MSNPIFNISIKKKMGGLLSKFYYLLLLLLFQLAINGCSPTRIIREFHDPVRLGSHEIHNKIIKVHMTDGQLYLLDSLISTNDIDSVSGYGYLYDQYRDLVKTNKTPSGSYSGPPFKIPSSGISLFETNDIKGLNRRYIAMTLVGVPTLAVTIYCIINPKSCFGSCPTFYAWDGKDTCLMAEGFSSSILRSLEKRDIDMLYSAKATGKIFNLGVKNEALETHVIRYANLLLFPRSDNKRVFATEDGRFFSVSSMRSPSACIAAEGDCLEKIRELDNAERYSDADSKNLLQKEFIELEFKSPPAGETGLIISSRQTFMTTYLFYQSMAYLGNSAGNFASKIESGDSSLKRRVDRVWDLLGGIEVQVLNKDGKWIKEGEIREMGPIASDIHLIKLPVRDAGTLKIRLKLTKGLWRIDWLSLATIDQCVDPITISPKEVVAENSFNKTDIQVSDTLPLLVTLPGDSYKLVYELPADQEYEFFLDSKGYYIEWMREAWLEEESPVKAALLFGFPRIYMRVTASEFKKMEPDMERMFWKSRYVKKD